MNTFENALSVYNHSFDQDLNMKCELHHKGMKIPTPTTRALFTNLAPARLSVVTFLCIPLVWGLIVCPALSWAAPLSDPGAMNFSSALARAQTMSGEVTFTVVDVRRPVTRAGRRLTSPRYVYLMASRSPSKGEARPLAKSEKRALRKTRKSRRSRKARRRTSREAESTPSTLPRVRPWEGRWLKVYRLSPADAQEVDAQARDALESRMRQYEQSLIDKRDAYLAELSRGGSPIALSTPN